MKQGEDLITDCEKDCGIGNNATLIVGKLTAAVLKNTFGSGSAVLPGLSWRQLQLL